MFSRENQMKLNAGINHWIDLKRSRDRESGPGLEPLISRYTKEDTNR